MDETAKSPSLVALAGWMVPGLGYLLIGEKTRGLIVGVTIIILFMSGILIAGVRVIDVPGYDEQGKAIEIRTGPGPNDEQWILFSKPLMEIANKPWYVAQVLAGPLNLIVSKVSIDASKPPSPAAASPYPKVKARLGEIGTLYTAIAGMLNLLAMMDAAHRAAQKSVE
jgi:hypothetical protein